jgi:ATP-dependent Clp protease adapter protein ClpS
MAGPGTIERPEIEERLGETHDHGYIVTVYDNDFNTFDEVMAILMIATGCTFDEAQTETWEVHHLGRSVVHHGEEEICSTVAEIIAEIGIRVEVTKE